MRWAMGSWPFRRCTVFSPKILVRTHSIFSGGFIFTSYFFLQFCKICISMFFVFLFFWCVFVLFVFVNMEPYGRFVRNVTSRTVQSIYNIYNVVLLWVFTSIYNIYNLVLLRVLTSIYNIYNVVILRVFIRLEFKTFTTLSSYDFHKHTMIRDFGKCSSLFKFKFSVPSDEKIKKNFNHVKSKGL